MLKKLSYIFSRNDKIKICILMVVVIIGSFFELISVSIFSPFIELIMSPDALQESSVMAYIYNLFSFESIEYFLVVIACVIIVIYIVKNVYIIIEKNYIYRFSYRIQRNLSTNLLRAYMKEPYTFHLNKNISILQYAGRYRSIYKRNHPYDGNGCRSLCLYCYWYLSLYCQ